MRDRRVTTLRALREAVYCLPRTTRLAMLDGIDRNPIIVGAYTDEAGICPMLAAHRGGGRTSFIGFAKAWDGFAFRGSSHRRARRARRATERELLVLRTYLEASLLADECPDEDLAAATAEHRALLARRTAGVPPPEPAPRWRPGGHWMRIVRSLDEYERALHALEDQRPGSEAGSRPAPRAPASA